MPTTNKIDIYIVNNLYSLMVQYMTTYGSCVAAVGDKYPGEMIGDTISCYYDNEIFDNYEVYIYCVKNRIYPIYMIDGEKTMLQAFKKGKCDILSLYDFYKSIMKTTSKSPVHTYKNVKTKIKFFMDSGFPCVAGTFKIMNFSDVVDIVSDIESEKYNNRANVNKSESDKLRLINSMMDHITQLNW